MLSNEDAVKAFRDGHRGNSKHIFHDDNQKLYSYGHHFVLAVKLDTGEYLINGDTYSSSTSHHTSLCIRHLGPNVIIPFSALDQVTRDYHLIKLVDRSSDIYIPRTRKDPKTGELVEYKEHRLGAAVIKFENRYYLSSIDDGARGRGGYFLVELPERATTVDEPLICFFQRDCTNLIYFFVRANFSSIRQEWKRKNFHQLSYCMNGVGMITMFNMFIKRGLQQKNLQKNT